MRIDTIAKKIFLITFTAVLVFFGIITVLLYYYFPAVYKDYLNHKIDSVNNEVVNYMKPETTEGEKLNTDEVIAYIEEIGEANGIDIRLYSIGEDGSKTLIYGPNVFNRINPELKPEDMPMPEKERTNENVFNSELLVINDGTYMLQTEYDARNVTNIKDTITYIIPYFILMILVISAFIALLFAQYISRPIVKLSNKSKEFSRFNFSVEPVKYGRDEIGQLNRDLDQMGIQLNLAFDKLNHEVEIAKHLETERRNQLAIMSHELKTPLTIIKGQLEMMILNVGKYKDRDKYLQESLEKAESMQQLIFDILLSSDIESMDKLKDATQYNVVDKVNKLIKELSILDTSHKINFKHGKEKFIIDANPVIFDQILKNIIENAIKYTEDKEDINITFEDNVLLVQNKNSKVTNNDLQKLFEPFTRFEKSRNSSKGGHGLGLFIIKKGLDIHNFKYYFTTIDDIVTFKIDFN